jgi:uncharacterized tellurite resistance protein B-like protein
MIIFGTRGVKSTMSEGKFNCPQCETQRDYRLRKVTQFFTLYFIPLIPLGKKGEFVECRGCKGTFIPNVLKYQKNSASDKFLSEYEKAIKHCMVMIMLADGVIDPSELAIVLKIINKFSHNDMTLPELEAYTATVEKNPEDVGTYLKRITPSLNEHGKEVIIKCGIAVAASDGHVDDTEIAMIQQMADAMEMSSSHLKGIMHETMTPTHSDN